MEAMRKSWTDDRLDDFAKNVDRRFDEVDRRFDEVDRRLDSVDHELHRVNVRLDGMARTMVQSFTAMTAAIMAGYAATIGLVIALQ